MPHSKNPVRRNKKLILVIVAAITLVTWINPKYSFLNLYSDNGQIKRLSQPPSLNAEHLQDLELVKNSTIRTADILAEILAKQVVKIQDSTNCRNGHTLSCGHSDDCGMGCQLHHRATCLMMSYVMNIPLIHDERTAWPFSSPWTDAFQPLGSNCSRNEKTIYVEWRSYNTPILYVGGWCRHFKSLCPKESQYEFPMLTGIPVTSRLVSLIKENGLIKDPFLWFVGQFILLTIQQSDKQSRIVEEAMREMKLDTNFPLVGLHVRRTDKITEAKDSRHEIEEYVQYAREFFEETESAVLTASPLPRTIFVASDDHTVLSQAQKRYTPTTWRIVGMKSDHTFAVQWERQGTLHEIVRDIHILSQCDYIVCGLSSNICRLIYEIIAGQMGIGVTRRKQRLKSLDGQYAYIVQDFTIPSTLIAV